MKKEKVAVAMSGGVDSSMTAALVQAEEYEVIGMTLRLLPQDAEGTLWGQAKRGAVEEAAEAAAKLGIPHQVVDVHEAFEREIVSSFCRAYLSGRTPNPCVVCNQKIKFGLLLNEARRIGASRLATGHYARTVYDSPRRRHLLRKGKDLRKDQSYFLFALNQEQLGSVLFPLGELSKVKVREMAAALDLPCVEKPESQEICFIPDNDYAGFILRRLPEAQQGGPIVLADGSILGEHRGLFFFTIGQRRGLRVSRGHPLYVIGLDAGRNAVVVGTKEEALRSTFLVDHLNWIERDSPQQEMDLAVRIRYRHRESRARVIPLPDGTVKVEFYEPQLAITPGQAAVFYQGDVVVGGGWISS
jgi:tRNA-uridine 2-sulfurtransferase